MCCRRAISSISLCLTNFTPAAPTRGAGRPQGTFVMERLLDAIAEKLEVTARRSAAPQSHSARADALRTPVKQRDGSRMTYDSGDYPECQRRALAASGWERFSRASEEGARAGPLYRHRPRAITSRAQAADRSKAPPVGSSPSGPIVVATGATAQGQGVKSMLAQLVAGQFGVKPEDIGSSMATPRPRRWDSALSPAARR